MVLRIDIREERWIDREGWGGGNEVEQERGGWGGGNEVDQKRGVGWKK